MPAFRRGISESSSSDLEGLGQVATHDLLDVLAGQAVELLGVGDRVGQTLRVWEVRAEDDAVGADGLDEAEGVLLEEGVDPYVAAKDRDRVFLVQARLLGVRMPRASMSGRTQLDPFSTGSTRRSGNRDSMPWQTAEAMASKIPRLMRCCTSPNAVVLAKGKCSSW